LVDVYESPVIIAGNSTLTGPADIELGTLQVDGSQPSSAVGVQRYGTLSGTGTVGPITTTNGTISPGDSPTVTGILSAEGNVTLDAGSTFNVALNGSTAGTVYDQLNATGSVNLGGSTLTGSLGFTPAAGETFTIIKSTAPIVGTFAGLTLSPAGSDTIRATSDQLTPATSQITVNAAAVVDGPKVVSVLRYGYHMMPTTVVLTFDQALNAITAQDDQNYRIIGPAGRVICIKSAVYDPAALTVTLHPRQRINIHHAYKLIVDGTAPKGLTNTLGQLLDGVGDGRPDSNYTEK